MKKIKITEDQYKKLMSLDEAWIDNDPKEDEPKEEVAEEVITEDEAEKDCEDKEDEKEDIFENVNKTFGNLEVRNLIKEGEDILGEVKSSYGVWGKMKWNEKGDAQGFDNVFKRLTYKLEM